MTMSKQSLLLSSLISGILIILLLISTVNAAVPGTNTNLSLSTGGTQADSHSNEPNTSQDGRFTAFQSNATNLVASDTNNRTDVFVRDNQNNTTTRVSVKSNGTQSTVNSSQPYISSSGRFVIFYSGESLDTNIGSSGGQVFIHDLSNSTTNLISQIGGVSANGESTPLDVSDDGNLVLFKSGATNLVTGDSNNKNDIFLKNISSGTITLISKNISGTIGNDHSTFGSMSCSGGIIAFSSTATNLVNSDTNGYTDVFLVNLITDAIENITITGNEFSQRPSVSCDGSYVVFEAYATNLIGSDTNTATDIFMYNDIENTIIRVSVDSSGAQSSGGSSQRATVSNHGYYVTYDSSATNLITGDANGVNDVFIKDTKTNSNQIISKNSTPTLGDSGSSNANISSDGSVAVYSSAATNLVASDTNSKTDSFHSLTGF